MRDTSREKEMQQTLTQAHFSFSFGLGSSQDRSGCYAENNLKGPEAEASRNLLKYSKQWTEPGCTQ